MDALAPTETVYFHPAPFAREKSLVDAVALLHTDRKFDASELATAMLQTALLSAEAAGAAALRVGKAPRLFGLRKVDALFVDPGRPDAPGFPEHSFEAKIRAFVATNRSPSAEDVFVHLLEEEAPDPHAWAVGLAVRGMAKRGLVEVAQTTRLKVFRSQSYALPPATVELAKSTSADGPRALLDRTRRDRPAEWDLLGDALQRAVRRQTQASDSGPD